MAAFLGTVNYTAILPEIVLVLFGLIILVWDLYSHQKRQLAYLAVAGTVLAFIALLLEAKAYSQGRIGGDYFGGMVTVDNAALFMKGVFLGAAVFIVLLSLDFMGQRLPKVQVEYYELIMFATLGTMFMAGSRDIIMIYLGLELSAQSSYVLAGLLRRDPRSNEAALKYFLNGALASAVLLFGISLLYGLTGVTHLAEMEQLLRVPPPQLAGVAVGPLALAAMIFIIAGFSFKVAAAPFHLWAPDTYEGAPTPVTGFFSIIPKGGTYVAIIRVFMVALPSLAREWSLLFAILAAASMTLGNFTALNQTNIKRMMAYSSISHAGYIMIGVAVGGLGTSAVLFYLLGYAIANVGIWAIIVGVENADGGSEISGFKGLFYRSPIYALCLVFFFLSLIGIPPTVGFFAKLFLFEAAMRGGYLWLAILMAINSAVSIGYYYGVVRTMFFERTGSDSINTFPAIGAVVTVSAIGTLAVALWSGPFLGLATQTINLFGQ